MTGETKTKGFRFSWKSFFLLKPEDILALCERERVQLNRNIRQAKLFPPQTMLLQILLKDLSPLKTPHLRSAMSFIQWSLIGEHFSLGARVSPFLSSPKLRFSAGWNKEFCANYKSIFEATWGLISCRIEVQIKSRLMRVQYCQTKTRAWCKH